MKVDWLQAFIALALGTLLASSPARAETLRAVTVPAGDLIVALEALAKQIDANLIYQPQQLRGLRTEGVRGTFTVRDAVQELVRGMRLRVSVDETTGAMLISAAPIERTKTSKFAPGPPAHAVSATDGAAEPGSRLLEQLIVTGSMLSSTAAAEEGAAPVTVVSLERIREMGATTAYEALRGLPEIAGYADNDTRAGAADTRQINLRGLGAQYTLVLINGRRLGQNSLNLIPFTAVLRIEILKDGASAVYGSDALAGVVNVILRDRYDGAEASLDYGNTTHFGDGAKTNATALLGIANERGSVMLSGQYEKWNPVLSTEHPLGKSDDLRPFGGPDRRFPRYNPGLIRLPDGRRVMLDRGFTDGRTGESAADYVAAYDDRIDKQRISNLQNGREAGTFFGSARYALLETRAELFTDFLHKSTNVDYIDHRGVQIDADVPAANHWNPFGQDVHVTYVLDATTHGRQERALEALASDIETDMLTLGVAGRLGPLDYSFATTDWTSTDRQTHEGLSRKGILAQLSRSDPLALDVFGNAAVTAEQLAPARTTSHRQLTHFSRSTTGIVRFEPFSMPAGPTRIAAGFEYRHEGVDSQLDDALSRDADSISLAFLNDPNVKADRKVDAYFIEANLPLAGSGRGIAAAHALDLTVAARRESFSDFGAATVKRATLRWQPADSDGFTLRASYSETFYAPELRDIQVLGDSNISLISDSLIQGGDGRPIVYTTINVAGGNPDLNPTLGEYKNLGAIFKPEAAPGLRLIADLWRLDQKDAFVYPTVQAVVDGFGQGAVVRGPVVLPGEPVGRIVTVVNRVENAAWRTVAGVDLGISYRRDAGRWGRWEVQWHSTFITRFDYDQKNGRGAQNALGLISSAFDVAPRFRSNLILSDSLGALDVTLATTYVGSVSNAFDDYRRVEPYMRTNLMLAYDLGAVGSLGAGVFGDTQLWASVQDLFDEGAPFIGVLRTQGVASDFTYVDYIGQFWTLGFRTKF